MLQTSSDQSPTVDGFLQDQQSLLVRLSRQNNLADLFLCVLREAMDLSHADGGTLYLLKGEEKRAYLEYCVIINDSLNIYFNGASGGKADLPPLPMFEKNGTPNFHNVATFVALNKELVNIANVYEADDFDFNGVKTFDRNYNYHSESFLTFPLLDHEEEVIGVIQLINAKDPDTQKLKPFSQTIEPTIEAMGTYAAIALDNQILLQNHKDLLDAFIQSLASITDVRSPHTSAHCQRIPLLTELIAQAACEADEGYFEHFELTEDEWYELKVAAWMHDCGKLATPDFIVEKATKLETVRDGIDAVNSRFMALEQKTRADYLEKMLAQPDQMEDLKAELKQRLTQLQGEREFVMRHNQGSEFMSPEDKLRMTQIAKLEWPSHDGMKPMLTDDELANLCITRGTINEQERAIINRHIDVTIDILESLPFPKNLKRVPEYAGGHHERMDGTGFPKGLTRDQMSIPARMMAIADIFEALTAKERPYKKPMPLSQTFSILKNMRDDNHIDPDIYQLFLRSGKWKQYAKEHMFDFQMDVDDVTPYL